MGGAIIILEGVRRLMSKVRLSFIAIFCFVSVLIPAQKVQALEFSAEKAKALGVMAGYGAAGGALLGTASLAFGAEPRAVAVGASLGLYAGLLFGAYVILSHVYGKNSKDPAPSGGNNTYEDPEYFSTKDIFLEHRQKDWQKLNGPTKQLRNEKPLYFNVLQFEF